MTDINLSIYGDTEDHFFNMNAGDTLRTSVYSGKSITFTYIDGGGVASHVVFKLDGNGAAVYPNKLKLLNDGNTYFAILFN